MDLKSYLNQKIILFLTLRTLANFLILAGISWLVISFYPVVKLEIAYLLSNRQTETYALEVEPVNESFGEILAIIPPPPPLPEEPVNKEAALIIPKIDVNVPIVWDVSVTNTNEYESALKKGVAHAKGTKKPSDNPGNTYLFTHSTLNPLEIEKYSAVFTLLHRLEKSDRITIFYQEKRYDYLVQNKEVVKSTNTQPLTRQPDYPMLTLQTCDPPGIPINRLIVTARLIAAY